MACQSVVAEAVSEVKRQAMTELRKAVAESELKASRLIAAERARLDAVVDEARKQAVDEILVSLRAPHDSNEVSWTTFNDFSDLFCWHFSFLSV